MTSKPIRSIHGDIPNDDWKILSPQENLDITETTKISNYIHDHPAKPEIITSNASWVDQRESTRTEISIYLVKFLGCSLVASFIMAALSAFYPNIDKTVIKDLIPQIITPQVALLGVALGFYFGSKEQ
jgi:hypothetical protein